MNTWNLLEVWSTELAWAGAECSTALGTQATCLAKNNDSRSRLQCLLPDTSRAGIILGWDHPGLGSSHSGPWRCPPQVLKRTDLCKSSRELISLQERGSEKFSGLSRNVEPELGSKLSLSRQSQGRRCACHSLAMPGVRVQVVPGPDGVLPWPCEHSYLVTAL